MLGLDRDAESSYANLGREITGLPLVGMTLAGGDETWSARHWDVGNGRHVHYTESTNVRVIGDRLAVSWGRWLGSAAAIHQKSKFAPLAHGANAAKLT